ncbi:hypothetical protein NHX12_020266, partial [Muraenolepis orangiensis]
MVLFKRGVSITRKLGFSDVIMPGEMRNDLYITLEKGEFEKGGKSVARNVEVTVYVLDIDGQILKHVKLPIPVDMFRGSHVRFEFRHCSTKDKGEKKLFGYSFVPLMQEDGRTLPDGTHELIIHKCEENANLADCSRYIKLPFSKPNLPANNQTLKSTKESFWITSFLCSTKLTQNAHQRQPLQFLQDTLDTLFGILDESAKRYGLKVFDSLVHIINLLQDSKFQHFKPVMDTYIESHFAGALSYRDLIKVLKWYVDRIVEAEHQDHIQQASEYIFKYIIQSRRLYSLATGGQNEDEFRICVHELFMSIRFFLSQENKGTCPAVFLRTFPAVYSELLKIFTVREVAGFVRETLSSLPTAAQSECPLEAVKLQCISKTVESQLYINPESRCILLPVVLRLLQAHMQEQRELVMCARILTSMLSLIKKEETGTPEPVVSEEVELIVASLLGVLLRTILEITNRPQPGEFVGCLLALLREMSDRHYQQLLQSFTNKEDLRDFLLQIFTVFRILIRPEMFPKDWTVWDSYFYLSVIFINQPCLQLESFSPSKRKRILEKYGDMRVMMGCEIFSMWQNLGEHKLNFIPAMIGPFLEVTLVPQPDLRNVMIPIFHDMMDWEQRRSGNFKQVEAKLIDKLDSLMSEGKGDETYRELFNSIASSLEHVLRKPHPLPPFTPSPTECPSAGLVSNSPVLSGSYSSGISSLSRCSVSDASATEYGVAEGTVGVAGSGGGFPNSASEEPVRRENKTPPPYS